MNKEIKSVIRWVSKNRNEYRTHATRDSDKSTSARACGISRGENEHEMCNKTEGTEKCKAKNMTDCRKTEYS